MIFGSGLCSKCANNILFEELFKDTGIAGVLDSAELSYESSCAMLRRETLPLR